MEYQDALAQSPSRSAVVETDAGRLRVTGEEPQVFLHFTPKLADTGLLNDAGSTVHEYSTFQAATDAATSEYGADGSRWLPVEHSHALRSTTHTPAVEGRHLTSDHDE